MENEEMYEEMNEETVEEEKKGLKEKVKGFFGANSGSNGEGNGEESGYLPDPGSDNDGNTVDTTDYVEDMTTDENDDGMSETNESEGSAE